MVVLCLEDTGVGHLLVLFVVHGVHRIVRHHAFGPLKGSDHPGATALNLLFGHGGRVLLPIHEPPTSSRTEALVTVQGPRMLQGRPAEIVRLYHPLVGAQIYRHPQD